MADTDKIEKKIKSLVKQGFNGVLRLGGMTDCLQACEAQHKVTLKTIKMLNDVGIEYLIVTKSHLIAKDEYANVLDKNLAHVQLSVTNTNDRDALLYEKASLTSKRLQALSTLQNMGVDVCLRLSPYFRDFIEFDVIAKYEPQKILVEFLRINHWIKKWLNSVGMFDLRPYVETHGGYQHLPLLVKEMQMSELREAFPLAQISVCEDVPEHYAHWQLCNPNASDCCNLRRVVK